MSSTEASGPKRTRIRAVPPFETEPMVRPARRGCQTVSVSYLRRRSRPNRPSLQRLLRPSSARRCAPETPASGSPGDRLGELLANLFAAVVLPVLHHLV